MQTPAQQILSWAMIYYATSLLKNKVKIARKLYKRNYFFIYDQTCAQLIMLEETLINICVSPDHFQIAFYTRKSFSYSLLLIFKIFVRNVGALPHILFPSLFFVCNFFISPGKLWSFFIPCSLGLIIGYPFLWRCIQL